MTQISVVSTTRYLKQARSSCNGIHLIVKPFNFLTFDLNKQHQHHLAREIWTRVPYLDPWLHHQPDEATKEDIFGLNKRFLNHKSNSFGRK